MSEMQHYKGVIVKVEKDGKDTIDLVRHCLLDMGVTNETVVKNDPSELEDWLDLLSDLAYKEYYYDSESDELYKVTKEYVDDEGEIMIAERLTDKIYSFDIRYYDGGCSMTEAIEDSIRRLNKR